MRHAQRARSFTLRSLGALLGLVLAGPQALAVQVGFDELTPDVVQPMGNAPGTPIPMNAQLSDQLASTHGVVFRSGSPYVPVVFVLPGAAAIGGSAADGTLSYETPIVLEFVLTSNPLLDAATNYFEIVGIVGDLSAPAGGTLQAFDIFGNLVGSDTGQGTGNVVLSVSTAGFTIHSVQITGSPTVAWDNLQFNDVVPVATVPEPGTVALIIASLGAAAGRRWRRAMR